MKKIATLALFLCMFSLNAGLADNNVENWCGTYFEDNGQGFLRLAREDFGTGSSNCDISEYHEKAKKSGTANIALNFSRSSTLNNWRKFNNHVIEIRGKFHNGYIKSTRFVRDMGV